MTRSSTGSARICTWLPSEPSCLARRVGKIVALPMKSTEPPTTRPSITNRIRSARRRRAVGKSISATRLHSSATINSGSTRINASPGSRPRLIRFDEIPRHSPMERMSQARLSRPTLRPVRQMASTAARTPKPSRNSVVTIARVSADGIDAMRTANTIPATSPARHATANPRLGGNLGSTLITEVHLRGGVLIVLQFRRPRGHPHGVAEPPCRGRDR